MLRGGERVTCPPADLVKGDLIVLKAGDQVPADAIVRSGFGAANESLLTGESDNMRKAEGDWLMSGSYITEGSLLAQLERVGAESYAARLTRDAKAIKRPKSALMADLDKLIRFDSMVLVPLGLMLFARQYFLNHVSMESAVTGAAAAMIGMIPEGLILLTSVALAVGVVRLGKRQTLVQELYGIETLARADVLCLDKTGTITTGDMGFKAFVPVEADEAELSAAVCRFCGAFDTPNGTLLALQKAFPAGDERPVAVLPFSSERKKSAAAFADGQVLVLGAPSFVLGSGYPAQVRTLVDREAAQGARVLVLAEARGTIAADSLPPVSRVLGLVLLEDVIRPGAGETLRWFAEQGVGIRVISGDNPVTVSAIARKLGLHGEAVDVSALSDEQLAEAAKTAVVFGRVTPDRKRTLVELLKQAGHHVAMTGDGVNDIPALKAADCSIAMASGADATRHAAQLTLLNSDFTSLPEIVAEGRRVVNNITRAASLFLVKTLYSFALCLLLIFVPAAYPFQPIQLTLISTLTIGAPSFFLALESNRSPIRGSFLRTVLRKAVPGAVSVTVCAVVSMLLEHGGWDSSVCSTLSTISAAAMGLLMLARCAWPFSTLRRWVVIASAVALVGAVLLLGKVFFLVALPASAVWILAGLILAGAALQLAADRVMKKRE